MAHGNKDSIKVQVTKRKDGYITVTVKMIGYLPHVVQQVAADMAHTKIGYRVYEREELGQAIMDALVKAYRA